MKRIPPNNQRTKKHVKETKPQPIKMMPKSVKFALCTQQGIVLPEMKSEHKITTEIKELQRTVNSLIPPTSFAKCVKEMIHERSHNKIVRIEKQVHSSLQSAAENYLVKIFQEANLMANHAKRSTVNERDMLLAVRLTSPL